MCPRNDDQTTMEQDIQKGEQRRELKRLGTDVQVTWFIAKKGIEREENAEKVMMVPNNDVPQIPGFRIWTEEVLCNDWTTGYVKVL